MVYIDQRCKAELAICQWLKELKFFVALKVLSLEKMQAQVLLTSLLKNHPLKIMEKYLPLLETIIQRYKKVNRYIWQAALDVLDFMPIETIDPFSGVIVKGFGVPPGGKTQYRATIYVVDPALEARSLRVSMQTKSGPVSTATMNEIENAILSRARQMRKADGLS